MTTKIELIEQIGELEKELKREKSLPKGLTVSQCSIDMTKPDTTKLAIANAVAEGMKALQSLGGDSYGLYVAAPENTHVLGC